VFCLYRCWNHTYNIRIVHLTAAISNCRAVLCSKWKTWTWHWVVQLWHCDVLQRHTERPIGLLSAKNELNYLLAVVACAAIVVVDSCVPSIDHDNRLNSSPRPAKTDIANLLFTGRRTGGRYRIHADERLEFLKHQALCCKHLNATKLDLYSSYSNLIVQEAQLSPRDRATRRNN